MNVYCRDLGQMDYKACWDLQQTLFDVLTAGKTNRTAAPESATPSSEEAGTILLVEHPPVYTLGKSGHAENLLVGREGYLVCEVNSNAFFGGIEKVTGIDVAKIYAEYIYGEIY